jgi:anti-sigma-K factor RskA
MRDDQAGDRNDDTRAAEYVLGVLSVDERREIQRRLATDSALRAEVEQWENRLAPLMLEVSAVEPSPHIWRGIEERIGVAGKPKSRLPRWESLFFWRSVAFGAAALAAASLAALVYVGTITPSARPMVANVAGAQSSFIAAIDPASRRLTIIPSSVAKVDQHSLQLWLIASGGKPQSLGLIESAAPVHVTLPAQIVVAADATLAVSLEPPGGSPTGQPTGPVIASGKITNL